MARRGNQSKSEKPVAAETLIAEWKAAKGQIPIEHLAWKYELSIDQTRKLIEGESKEQ